jgi:hypothetical protein
MKNPYVNVIFDLINADSGVKMANLNKGRKVGKLYEAERLCKIGMLPEHLKL